MKKKKLITLLIFVIVVVLVIGSLNIPLRRNEEKICKSITESIPLGTDFKTVLDKIEKHSDWEISLLVVDRGHTISGYDVNGYNKERFSGVSYGESIKVNIGYYMGFLSRTDVLVYFEFDEHYKLNNIRVYKETDSL